MINLDNIKTALKNAEDLVQDKVDKAVHLIVYADGSGHIREGYEGDEGRQMYDFNHWAELEENINQLNQPNINQTLAKQLHEIANKLEGK